MFDKIKDAEKLIKGIAHRTPVITSNTLNKLVNAEVFLKCENFQRAGAFKFRGAYNAISKLTDNEKQKGVITYSSGNHAQAVALVGKLLDVKTVVVMPQNSPIIKRAAALDYGAEIILYNPETSIREEVAKDLIEKHGYILIPPFDHYDIVAGQGTAALELFEEVGRLDYVLAPCGGGGLLSGTAIASKGINPDCKVIGVEPELADDATKSFYSKTLHTVKNPPTIADGTRTASMGKITFPLVLKYVDEMKTVSEEEIIDSVKFLFYRLKLVVEPSGALGIAALLGSKVSVSGRVGVIISGGNIDGATMKMILDS
jgi:threonine dehydratase